jgi:hypothetical protein
LNFCDNQTSTCFFCGGVSKVEDLLEVLSGVNVHHREGKLLGRECFFSEVKKNCRVFSTREQQHWAFAFGGYFSKNEDGV